MTAADEATMETTVGELLQRLLSSEDRLSQQNTELQARMTELVNERRDCAGLQGRVIDWVKSTFDEETQANTKERCLRFIEEALELAQAVGVSNEDITRLMWRVYGNPPGDVAKEVAGCGVTLMSIAGTLGVDLLKVTKDEIKRLESPEMRERARRRQDEKRAQLLTADKRPTAAWGSEYQDTADKPSVCKAWDG